MWGCPAQLSVAHPFHGNSSESASRPTESANHIVNDRNTDQDHRQDDDSGDPFASRKAKAKARKERFQLIREGKIGLGKVRQHVNPLRERFQKDVPVPVYADMFSDPQKPLHLDIGCAKGAWLTKVATNTPQRNHLGVEIREALAAYAAHNADGLDNCHFCYANVNVSVQTLVDPYPGRLEVVTVNNPDPYFKKKHRKRRVVTPEFVAKVASVQSPGGKLYVQSDVGRVYQDMAWDITNSNLYKCCYTDAEIVDPETDTDHGTIADVDVDAHATAAVAAVNIDIDDEGELKNDLLSLRAGRNPFGVMTEREEFVFRKPTGKIWRGLFVRTDTLP